MVWLQSLHSVGVVIINFFHLMLYFVLFLLIIILHGFCLHFSFFFLILHGVCVVGIMGYALVGGLILLFMYNHHFVYSLWSLCYIFLHLFSDLCFCVLISSFVCVPEFSFLPFVCFLNAWMKTFGGVWVHMYYMQPYVCFEMGIPNILCYSCYHWPG